MYAVLVFLLLDEASHQCTQAAAVDNLIGHCLKLGEYAKQIASAII